MAIIEGTFALSARSMQAVRQALQHEGLGRKALPAAAAGELRIRREVRAGRRRRTRSQKQPAATATQRLPARQGCIVHGTSGTVSRAPGIVGALRRADLSAPPCLSPADPEAGAHGRRQRRLCGIISRWSRRRCARGAALALLCQRRARGAAHAAGRQRAAGGHERAAQQPGAQGRRRADGHAGRRRANRPARQAGASPHSVCPHPSPWQRPPSAP